jgi:hypothetical protein
MLAADFRTNELSEVCKQLSRQTHLQDPKKKKGKTNRNITIETISSNYLVTREDNL